jgi:hypothetical protein
MQALGNDISVTYGPQAAAQMAQNSPFPVWLPIFTEMTAFAAGFERWQIWQVARQFPSASSDCGQHTGFLPLFGLDVPTLPAQRAKLSRNYPSKSTGRLCPQPPGSARCLELARTMPELAVIIGGHSHTLLEQGQCGRQRPGCAAGEYAAQLGAWISLWMPTAASIGAQRHYSACPGRYHARSRCPGSREWRDRRCG